MTPRKSSQAGWGDALVRECIARGRLPPDVLTQKVAGRLVAAAPAAPPVVPARPSLALPFAITVYGAPRTKKNSLRRRFGADGHQKSIPSKAFETWQSMVQPQLERAVGIAAPIALPVNVRALIYRATAVRGDHNGYTQAIGDVLQRAGVLADDYLIETWDGTRRRIDRDLPRVEITITEFTEESDQ